MRPYPYLAFAAALCLSVGSVLGQTPPAANSGAPTTSASGASDGSTPQEFGGKGGHLRARLQQLTDKLSLTADQQQKVGGILREDARQASVVRKDSTLSDEDRRAKLMQIRQSEASQIRALLTADQQTKFDAMKHGHGSAPAQPADQPAAQPPQNTPVTPDT